MRFKSTSSDQKFLLPPSIDEFVSMNSLARVVSDVVEQLDLNLLYSRFGTEGRPSYHPKMLLRVLFYAYSTGIQSSRKIAQRLQQDTHFMFLSGMQTPDFRTISDFRKKHLDLIKDFFKQIVLYCVELDMVTVGHIAIDGTKIKASASKKQSKDAESLQKEIEKLEQEISQLLSEAEQKDKAEDKEFGKTKRGDELPSQIQNKKDRKERLEQAKELLTKLGWNKINLTDPDSRFMKTTTHKQVSYNAQAAVDSDNQVIVANDVTTETSDDHQFIPMYEQTVENLGQTPKEASADCQYGNHKNYKYMRDNNINAYVPLDKKSLEVDSSKKTFKNIFSKEQFSYQAENDTYICPGGKELCHLCNTSRNDVSIRVYRSRNCDGCPLIKQCLLKNNKSKTRTLKIFETDPFVKEMHEKLISDIGREKYQKRMKTVEPVFGNIKTNLGFRSFVLRGHVKVRGEYNLMSIAHNIKKIHTYKFAQAA
jgi:transposase